MFKDSNPIFSVACDTIQFRVAWWFKHFGNGSKDPVTLLMLNIPELCRDPVKSKVSRAGSWRAPGVGTFKFNVDGSVAGQTGMAGIGVFSGTVQVKFYARFPCVVVSKTLFRLSCWLSIWLVLCVLIIFRVLT